MKEQVGGESRAAAHIMPLIGGGACKAGDERHTGEQHARADEVAE